MKKAYIQPMTDTISANLPSLMKSSAYADLDSGNNGGFTNKNIDMRDPDEEDGTDAKRDAWNLWDD